MLQPCAIVGKSFENRYLIQEQQEIHIAWFKALSGCLWTRLWVKISFYAMWCYYIHGVREYLELYFDCSVNCIMWVLQCQPCSAVWLILSSNTFSSKDGTNAVSGVNLCLFWQNVGEVKANKTNKQVSQQTVCVCMHLSNNSVHTPVFVNLFIHPPTRQCYVGVVSVKKKKDPLHSLSIAASISAAITLDFQWFLLSTVLNRLKRSSEGAQ